jgi:hypothetical protein
MVGLLALESIFVHGVEQGSAVSKSGNRCLLPHDLFAAAHYEYEDGSPECMYQIAYSR